MYELTPRELKELQKGYVALNRMKSPKSKDELEMENRKQTMKHESKRRARRQFANG